MHEYPAEVLGILFNPVVERLDFLLLEEPEHALLELARPLPGDDLDQRRLGADRLVDDAAQGAVDVLAAVVDVVQVELELHERFTGTTVRGIARTEVLERAPLADPSGRE